MEITMPCGLRTLTVSIEAILRPQPQWALHSRFLALPNGGGYRPIEGSHRVRFGRFNAVGDSVEFDLIFRCEPGRPLGRYQIELASDVFRAFMADLQRSGCHCFDHVDLQCLPVVVTFSDSEIVSIVVASDEGEITHG